MKPFLIWLRLYRVGVIATIAWLVYVQGRWFDAREKSQVSLPQAQSFFPAAVRLDLRDATRGLYYAIDAVDQTTGVLLTTAPESDHIIGYSGPNNVLLALDTNGAVHGVQLLASGDTPEHVDLVREDAAFLRRFIGWRPAMEAPPRIEAVAGATLTSYAIAEAIQQRLAGAAPSLRFPDPVTLREVQALITNAASLHHEGRKIRANDASGRLLGYVARTSPEADNVAGYRGPTEALVAIAPDGKRVTGVRLRQSYDTPSYAEQIREDETYLKLFEGRTLDQIATLDYRQEKIEGVSGATETSFAIAEGLKRRFASDVRARGQLARWKPKARDVGLAAVVAGACLMAFTPLRGKRWLRISWQAVLIGYVGLASGDLLSLSLFAGWATSGPAFRAAPGLVLLAAAAFIVPLFTRRQLYCHHICPHGAVQQWLGALRPRGTNRASAARFAPGFRTKVRRLGFHYIPFVLLTIALIALLARWPLDLSQIEPFDAWVWRTATVATLAIMIVGFAASIFIPQAYCRFGCPTGALLNFMRSPGSGDRWGARDWAAGALLAIAALTIGITRGSANTNGRDEVIRLGGHTMGTTWSVKIRGPVHNRTQLQGMIQAEFDRIEQLTSHWRTNTPLAALNRARTTNAIDTPAELTTLLRWSAELSEASHGAFDVTVAPLARLWGFGPDARRDTKPTDAEIDAARAAVGWTNIVIGESTVQKLNPAVEVDLSSIVPGWANDRISALLIEHGYPAFLVESGGELRAGGTWTIAIEHPARSCTLSNESIGTSGTYRQKWNVGGTQFSHLINPQTGRPVTHNTVSVSVRMPDCARADAWAAALNVLGIEAGLALAEQRGLAAQFVVEENGELRVRETTRWAGRREAFPGADASKVERLEVR